MKIIVTKNYDEMSKKAAELMAEIIKNKPDCVLGLATGSTPLGLYAKMAEDHKNNGTSYAECKAVNLDEYVGLAFVFRNDEISEIVCNVFAVG